MTNVHPETGIPYGYISANSLDPEVVQELMHGLHTRDLSYEEALFEAKTKFLRETEDRPDMDMDDDFDEQAFNDSYTQEEPAIEGTYEDVKYRSSWLGGALNFWIFFSPHTNNFDKCSPCVPYAGNLNRPNPLGDLAYDVPPDWRST